MFWRRKTTPPIPAVAPSDPEQAGLEAADQDDSDANPSTQFLTGDSEADRRSVEVLLDAIGRVSESRDLEQLLNDIVDRSIEVTGAERGLLILEGLGGQLETRVARSGGNEAPTDDLKFSTSIVRKVLASQQPLRATVQSDSDALELGRSVFDLKLRAVMCVALKARAPAIDAPPGSVGSSGARGVLYVDSRAATREFTRRDLGMFAALSQHISIALEQARLNLESLEKTRLEGSLEVASAIQSGLMPRIPEDADGFDVHGWYRPAERTSGDFFDFVRRQDGTLALVVGDVSGHGIGPALVTATAQATLRTYLKILPDLGQAVTALNADLSERIDEGMFLTLLVLAARADGHVEWINAGHHAPLLWRKATGALEDLAHHSLALGYVDDIEYHVDAQVMLEPGDVLVAFTDGLIEAHPPGRREELFGEERLRALVAEHAARGAGAREITEGLAQAGLEFSGTHHDDDITVVVLRRL